MEHTDPQAALSAIEDYPIFLAHNANVDALTHVDAELEAALEPPTGEEWPEKVDSPAALSTAITRTMERGRGDLLAMADEFDGWLGEHVTPDEQRLGGQAGIMTDLVSLLGGDPVFWTYLLSAVQRDLFSAPEGIRFPVVEDGELRCVPLREAPLADRTKRNWIFEFSEGEQLFDTTATADTRFIAASRPDRFNLETGLEPYVDELAAEVECALVSGYQSLKRTYDDGSTYREHIKSSAAFLRALSERGVTIQLEYGVTHKRGLRRAIIDRVLPEIDAVGMDARELELLREDLTHHGRRGPAPEIVVRYRNLRDLLPVLGVDCIKLHSTDYFIAVMDGYRDPEYVNDGWALSAQIAATKAMTGVIDEPEDLQTGLEQDFAEAGVASIETLAAELDAEADGPRLSVTGTDDGVAVAAHANRVVPDPVSTVGLGDSIAVGNFLVENALADKSDKGT